MSNQSSTTEQQTETADCTLSGADQQKRREWVREQIVPYYQESASVPDGLKLRFQATDETLLAVTELMTKEAVCCNSLSFELAYEPPYETFDVTITGPEGTQELLQEGFVEQFERTST